MENTPQENQVKTFLAQYLTHGEKVARCNANIEQIKKELSIWEKELKELEGEK